MSTSSQTSGLFKGVRWVSDTRIRHQSHVKSLDYAGAEIREIVSVSARLSGVRRMSRGGAPDPSCFEAVIRA